MCRLRFTNLSGFAIVGNDELKNMSFHKIQGSSLSGLILYPTLMIIHEILKPCADLEVGHSNTEESVLYFIKRKHNLF